MKMEAEKAFFISFEMDAKNFYRETLEHKK